MSDDDMIVDAATSSGGQGEDPSRSEMTLMRRAIREDWPIGTAKRQKIIDRMMSIVVNGEKDRDCVSAAKVVVAADSLNAKREAIDVVEARPTAGTTINVDNRRVTVLRLPDNGRGPAIEQQ